jgi:hypothetical protein
MAKKTKPPFGLNPVEYEVRVEPEDLPYKGNCMASGDEDYDREVEQWITDELNKGNEYAWCGVMVIARFEGFEGVDSLGGCSYKSMADLEEDLIPEMKENALANLRQEIQQIADHVVENAEEKAKQARAVLAKLERAES